MKNYRTTRRSSGRPLAVGGRCRLYQERAEGRGHLAEIVILEQGDNLRDAIVTIISCFRSVVRLLHRITYPYTHELLGQGGVGSRLSQQTAGIPPAAAGLNPGNLARSSTFQPLKLSKLKTVEVSINHSFLFCFSVYSRASVVTSPTCSHSQQSLIVRLLIYKETGRHLWILISKTRGIRVSLGQFLINVSFHVRFL